VEILIEQLRITIKALKRFDDEIVATVQKLLLIFSRRFAA